ncbi:type VII secretion protein EccB [Mycobacterium sp. DL592]|uniref:type VII secretion protein EccB n=1 Tax=Mycobacterium sp. DL592 TaxID=2675524 RepID=UPI00141F48B7|nr:type VII secretion protein EccB [Mycobacterium sp. DL592]
MRRPGSLRLQASASRFQWRRLEYAVLGRPVAPGEDPVRAHRRAMVAGCGLALGVGAVMAATTMVRPVPGDSPLVMSRQSGALFVRVGERLRPVTDLVSAELILGGPAAPRVVDDTALRGIVRGPVLGIPGAPRAVGELIPPVDQRWAVCDGAERSTSVGVTGWESLADLGPGAGVLVSAAHGDAMTYLLYDGRRARVDPADPVTARTLHLDGHRPRPVSSTLLSVIPEVPAIGPPRITGVGQPSGVAGFAVGSVVRTVRAGSEEFYVALREGFQRVGRLTADLIRFADPAATTDITSVSPDVVAGAALVDTLPVATYPDVVPTLLGDDSVGVCATWRSGTAGIAVGPVGTDGSSTVALAAADGDGPNVDAVAIPPGHSIDVTAGTSGRYLLSDTGVLFPVRDSAAADALGLGRDPAAVPWAFLAALPAGAELSRESALAGRDVLDGAAP